MPLVDAAARQPPGWASAVWEGFPLAFGGPLAEELALLAVLVRQPVGVPVDGVTLGAWRARLLGLLASRQAWVLDERAAPVLLVAFGGGSPREQVERALEVAVAARRDADHLGLLRPRASVQLRFAVVSAPLALSRPPLAISRDAVGGGGITLAQDLAFAFQEEDGTVLSEGAYLLAEDRYQAFGTGPGPDAGDRGLPPLFYALEGAVPTVSWEGLLDGHPASLLGRTGELRRLRAAWAATQAGEHRVIHLVAEPGAGKSKLLDDLAGQVGRQPGATLLRTWGACFGGGAGEAFDRLVGPLGAEAAGDGLAGARLLRRCPGPLAIFVDDLHWLDDASRRALVAMLRRASDVPLLAVLSYRPSILDREGLTAAIGGEVLELPPLADAAAQALLESTAGDLPPSRRAEMARAARGNPLYLEEAVALLREEPAATLPESLFALLLRRIDLWSARVLRLLEGGARSTLVGAGSTDRELVGVERQIADWLDRIESGSYLGPVETGVLFRRLRAVDLRIRVLRWRLGFGVPRNDRLRAALDRVLAIGADGWAQAVDEYVAATGDRRGAAEETIEMAERALLRHRPAVAARLLRGALVAGLGTEPDDETRRRLRVQLAESLARCGEWYEAGVLHLHLGDRARAAVMLARAGELVMAARLLATAGAREDSPRAQAVGALAAAEIAVAGGSCDAIWLSAIAIERAAEIGDPDLELEAAICRLGPAGSEIDSLDLDRLLGRWRDSGPREASIAALAALGAHPLAGAPEDVASRLAHRYRARAAATAESLGCRGWVRRLRSGPELELGR